MSNGILKFFRKKLSGNKAPTPGKNRIRLKDIVKTASSTALWPEEKLQKLGTQYGGWLIPANPGLDQNSICYLAGAGEDISFDCTLVKKYNCKARIIDPTPRAIAHFEKLAAAVQTGTPFPINNSEQDFYDLSPESLARITYLPFGLADQDTELKFYLPKNPDHVSCSTVNLQGTEDYFTARCLRLTSLMQQLGDPRIDLLKMDIEGGEYVVIQDMLQTQVLPRILLIEFDETNQPLDEGATSRIHDHIDKLSQAGLHCIAVDGCNATFLRHDNLIARN